MKLILALFAVQFAVALAQSESDAPSGDGDAERNRRYALLNHYQAYDVKLYSNEAGHSGYVIYGPGYGPKDLQQQQAASNTFAKKVTPAYKPQAFVAAKKVTPVTSAYKPHAFAAASYNARTTARPTVRTTPRKVTTKKPAFTSKSTFGGSSTFFTTAKPRAVPKQAFVSTKTNVKTTVRTTPRPVQKNKKPITPPVDCRLCSQYCSAKFY